MRTAIFATLVISVLGLSACAPKISPAVAPTPFRLSATIQDIMAAEVDPAADFIWEAVSSETTAGGTDNKQPRTNAEWLAVRHQAIVLVEATNLLVMEGRQVAVHGKQLEDAKVPGISSPEEIKEAIDADRSSFVKVVHALNEAGVNVLAAIDGKNVEALVTAGDALDHACENCHLKYWYPNSPRPKD
jgi:hypothetical protein